MANPPADHPAALEIRDDLGELYLLLGNYGDSERLLRECLSIRQAQESDLWRTFNTQSLLGSCFAAQKRFAEAEPLLLQVRFPRGAPTGSARANAPARD